MALRLLARVSFRHGFKRTRTASCLSRPAGTLIPHKIYPKIGNLIDNPLRLCLSRYCSLDVQTDHESVTVEEHTCCGCGVALQSRDPNSPGYIAKDVFKKEFGEEKQPNENSSSTDDLVEPPFREKVDDKPPICLRCFQLKHYSNALDVSVPEDEYLRCLEPLKDKKALILLMVDVVDFPGSLFPNIRSFIKPGNPVVIVGNKMDLLPSTSNSDLHLLERHIRTVAASGSLRDCFIERVVFISVKEDTGVDTLTHTIVNSWGNRGNVFLLGCTNVGKSSLFNRLLVSLCGAKPGRWSKADNMRAPAVTISQWPGTTLDLVSFPIMSVGKRQRLLQQAQKKGLYCNTPFGEPEQPDFFGNWTHNPRPKELDIEVEQHDIFRPAIDADDEVAGVLREIGLKKSKPRKTRELEVVTNENPKHRFWLYDTPGAVNSAQIINVLTTEELKLALPEKQLIPRTFILKPGQSLMFGGLARLDYMEGDESAYFTAFVSKRLPIHATRFDKIDTIYAKHLGEPLLAVPCGDTERLSKFPALLSEEYTLTGIGWKFSCADIVLSSVGWVGVTIRQDAEIKLKISIALGKGVFVRKPSLFSASVNERGRRSQKGNRTSFKGRKKNRK